ncbi:MAG TPA: hypothetical protein V6D19_22750 [Stenomitos sp.]
MAVSVFGYSIDSKLVAVPLQVLDQGTTPSQAFYGCCNCQIRDLLCRCRWQVAAKGDRTILSIICPSTFLYGRVLASLEAIGQALRRLSVCARIRIYRPLSFGIPFELGVEELS